MTDSVIKVIETTRRNTLVVWLSSSADKPPIRRLRTKNGSAPYLSAKTPVGITIIKRQMLGTAINNPA